MAAPADDLGRTATKHAPSPLLPLDSTPQPALDPRSSGAYCACCCRPHRRATSCLCWVVAVLTLLALVAGVSAAPRLLGGARVAVRFREQRPPLSGLGGVYFQHPTTFKRRISSLYLASDIDPVTQNNLGLPGCNTPTVYFSPDCNGSHDCDIDGAPADRAGRHTHHLVRIWFDFLRREEEMNAELNSYEVALCPGIYRYVRIEWTKHAGESIAYCDGYDGQRLQPGTGDSRPCPFTHMWQSASMARPYYSTGGGSVATIKLDDPVEVSWGSHTWFEIELYFSLIGAIVQDPAECHRISADEATHTSPCLCATDAGNGQFVDTDELVQVPEPIGPCLRPPRFRAKVIRSDGEGL
jgi:hypothetical protein